MVDINPASATLSEVKELSTIEKACERGNTASDHQARQELEEGILKSPDASSRTIQGLRWALLYTAVFSAQFLFALDNTIVADVQPAIVEDFGEVQKLPWIIVAFELGNVSVGLVW